MDASDGIAYRRTLKEMEENFTGLYPDNEENKPIMIQQLYLQPLIVHLLPL
jgi:hypothetical protein